MNAEFMSLWLTSDCNQESFLTNSLLVTNYKLNILRIREMAKGLFAAKLVARAVAMVTVRSSSLVESSE